MKKALFCMAILALCAGLGFGFGHYFRPRSVPQNVPADSAGEPPSRYPLAAPPLRLRTIKWDFDTSPPGKELNHRFEITNDTEKPWTLKSITPGCACTVGSLSSKIVVPGETTALKVAYRTPPRDGKVAEHIMVEFAEPASPVIQLTIEGKVHSPRSPVNDSGR